MSNWRKLLDQMIADGRPDHYTYDDAATVLDHVGFTLASNSGTSHRKWRLKVPERPVIVIGLLDRGHGHMNQVYIKDMIRILRENDLLPKEKK